MEVRGNERADCLASKAVVVNGNVKTMDRGYYILNAISIPDNVGELVTYFADSLRARTGCGTGCC